MRYTAERKQIDEAYRRLGRRWWLHASLALLFAVAGGVSLIHGGWVAFGGEWAEGTFRVVTYLVFWDWAMEHARKAGFEP